METATLTKNEEAHVERMADSFTEPTMSERFNEWATRTVSEAKREEKKAEGKHRPREVKLEDRSDEEKKFLETVGQKDESEKKPPAKNSAEQDAAKPGDAKESGKPDAKAAEKPAASESDDSHAEPIAADLAERHWQGKLQGPEIQNHINQVSRRAGIIMKHLEKSPDRAQMEAGFRAIFAGRPPAEQQGLFRDLSVALAEVPDPAAVFQHITLQSQDREILRKVKNPKELRAAIQTISKHYPATASQASPKPRAPKPPSEVGGRGAAGDDGTRESDSFSDFSRRQSQQYR